MYPLRDFMHEYIMYEAFIYHKCFFSSFSMLQKYTQGMF